MRSINVTQSGFGLVNVSEENKITNKDCVLMRYEPQKTISLMKETPFSYYISKNKQQNIQREKIIKGVP